MGGKKKKGLSNRLAKMSDEERARYLQHRAAIEEEARRRKEQLIATYMKNKLKREEAFTRLNIAKINEQWHQLLRKIKIKELYTEIEELSGWITKILQIKNSIIKRLLHEQEEAEAQYVHNLQSHLSHVDNFVDMHYERQKDLKHDFIKHKESTVDDALKEMDTHIIGANNQERYLKTVLFTMETNFNDIQKQLKTFRDNHLEDQSNSLKAERETMVKKYSMTMDKQWRDINSILSEYLARTTVRRHHYIELKHLDERNTTERLDNERRITRYTEQINSLNFEYELLSFNNESQIKDLAELISIESEKFRKSKQNLTYLIRKDEKQLEHLAVTSNNAIKTLEDVIEMGKTVLQWITYCRRLESDEETLICWAKIHKKLDQFEEVSEVVDSTKSKDESAKKEDEDSTSKVESKNDKDSNSVDSKMEIDSSKSDEDISNIEDLPRDVEEIFIAESVIDSSDLDLLEKMSGLCWCINRVEIECMELKNQKLDLIASNQNMKGIIKGILIDAALDPPVQLNLGNYYQVRPKILSAPPVMSKQISFIVIDL